MLCCYAFGNSRCLGWTPGMNSRARVVSVEHRQWLISRKNMKRYTVTATIICHCIAESMFHWIKHDKSFSSDLDPTPNPETKRAEGGHGAELRSGSTTQPWFPTRRVRPFLVRPFLATTSIFRWSVGLWRLNSEKSSQSFRGHTHTIHGIGIFTDPWKPLKNNHSWIGKYTKTSHGCYGFSETSGNAVGVHTEAISTQKYGWGQYSFLLALGFRFVSSGCVWYILVSEFGQDLSKVASLCKIFQLNPSYTSCYLSRAVCAYTHWPLNAN